MFYLSRASVSEYLPSLYEKWSVPIFFFLIFSFSKGLQKKKKKKWIQHNPISCLKLSSLAIPASAKQTSSRGSHATSSTQTQSRQLASNLRQKPSKLKEKPWRPRSGILQARRGTEPSQARTTAAQSALCSSTISRLLSPLETSRNGSASSARTLTPTLSLCLSAISAISRNFALSQQRTVSHFHTTRASSSSKHLQRMQQMLTSLSSNWSQKSFTASPSKTSHQAMLHQQSTSQSQVFQSHRDHQKKKRRSAAKLYFSTFFYILLLFILMNNFPAFSYFSY